MSTWFRSVRQAGRDARRRSLLPSVEGLDRICLLDGGMGAATSAVVADLGELADNGDRGRDNAPTGIVTKAPNFYELYIGPKLPQLNAVAAAGELLPDGSFLFAGVNQGKIDPTVAQTYVWGVDRNGNLGSGPFPNRPDVKFDAVVVLTIKPGVAPTASVTDLASRVTTPLPVGDVFAQGRLVAVAVPGIDLPSTGLAPAQYRFNYWPEDGQRGSTHIASFAPEFTDARVGVLDARGERGHGDGHSDRLDLDEVVAVLTGNDDDNDNDRGDGQGGRNDKKHGRG